MNINMRLVRGHWATQTKIPSEMDVAPRYTLLTIFTLFTLYTVQTASHRLNCSMYAYLLLGNFRTLLGWAEKPLGKILDWTMDGWVIPLGLL